jgi:hypothetical protein
LLLVGIRKEFYLSNQFHIVSIAQFQYLEIKERRFLPAASGRGIHAYFQ